MQIINVTAMARMVVTGYPGIFKGRDISGFFFLKTKSDKQTMHSRILPANTLIPNNVPKEPVHTNTNAIRQLNYHRLKPVG